MYSLYNLDCFSAYWLQLNLVGYIKTEFLDELTEEDSAAWDSLQPTPAPVRTEEELFPAPATDTPRRPRRLLKLPRPRMKQARAAFPPQRIRKLRHRPKKHRRIRRNPAQHPPRHRRRLRNRKSRWAPCRTVTAKQTARFISARNPAPRLPS